MKPLTNIILNIVIRKKIQKNSIEQKYNHHTIINPIEVGKQPNQGRVSTQSKKGINPIKEGYQPNQNRVLGKKFARGMG